MRQRLPEAEWGIRGPSSRYGSFVKKLLVVTVLCSLVLAGADGEASAGSPANGSLTIVRVTQLSNLPWDVRSKFRLGRGRRLEAQAPVHGRERRLRLARFVVSRRVGVDLLDPEGTPQRMRGEDARPEHRHGRHDPVGGPPHVLRQARMVARRHAAAGPHQRRTDHGRSGRIRSRAGSDTDRGLDRRRVRLVSRRRQDRLRAGNDVGGLSDGRDGCRRHRPRTDHSVPTTGVPRRAG